MHKINNVFPIYICFQIPFCDNKHIFTKKNRSLANQVCFDDYDKVKKNILHTYIKQKTCPVFTCSGSKMLSPKMTFKKITICY